MKNDNINNDEIREFAPDSFELVNRDLNSKIHDEKFKTRPTTFARDAFKRFCKNKSSVVGAIIIGFLMLCSFFVPVITQENMKDTRPDQAFLEPKLFNAGTGWWDGTKKYPSQILDRYNVGEKGTLLPSGGPDSQGFKEDAIISMKEKEVDTVAFGTYSEYAYDGYLMLTAGLPLESTDDPESKALWLSNYTPFNLKKSDDVKLEVELGDEDNISSFKLVKKYRVCLYQSVAGLPDQFKLDLTGGWVDITSEKFTIDLSSKLDDLGVTSLNNSKIRVQGLPYYEESKPINYLLVKGVSFVVDESVVSEEAFKLYESISFRDRTDEEISEAALEEGVKLSDANAVAGYGKDSKGNAPIGYWQANCTRTAYKSKIKYVDVVYDGYEHVYGDRTMIIGGSIFDQYIANGWCRFEGISAKIANLPEGFLDLEVNKFVVLDAEKCPVKEVKSVSYLEIDGEPVWQFTCKVTYYKYLGKSSMPRFLFGTDGLGFDLLTRCFYSLKTSLLVAVICVSICLAIGLVWGAISGYFGGTVDLVMERVTDIIAGLPSIILMTLILILMGRTIIMFAFSIILTGWIGTASLTRTQFYRFRDREYVLASRTLGASDMRLIFKHILPNGLGTIITSSVLRVPSFIATEATIAYLGIGLKTTDSFGVILSTNQNYVNSYPTLIAFPAAILALLMICFNLFGNGLRDAVNPTLKGEE